MFREMACHKLFHNPVTWYRNQNCWDASSTVGKIKQPVPFHLDLPLFWKSHSATCVQASQHVWFCTMWHGLWERDWSCKGLTQEVAHAQEGIILQASYTVNLLACENSRPSSLSGRMARIASRAGSEEGRLFSQAINLFDYIVSCLWNQWDGPLAGNVPFEYFSICREKSGIAMVFAIRIPFVLSVTAVFRTNNLISSTDLGQSICLHKLVFVLESERGTLCLLRILPTRRTVKLSVPVQTCLFFL